MSEPLTARKEARSVLYRLEGCPRTHMFIMLLAADGLYLLMGEPVDALMLLGYPGQSSKQNRHTDD